MIREYFRPKSIKEALQILNKPGSIILSGGTYITSEQQEIVNVVDIQELKLNYIQKNKNQIIIGSCTILQDLITTKYIPDAMRQAVITDSSLNIRNKATVGGYIVTATGISTLSTVLLSMEATVQFTEGVNDLIYTEFITELLLKDGRTLITAIKIPLVDTVFKSISSTPTSRSIICASLSTRKSGRTRLALGGFGNNPLLVFDGSMDDDIVSAAKSAYQQAGDEWASSDYRSEMAAILTKRCIVEMRSNLQKNTQLDE